MASKTIDVNLHFLYFQNQGFDDAFTKSVIIGVGHGLDCLSHDKLLDPTCSRKQWVGLDSFFLPRLTYLVYTWAGVG